MEQVEAEKRTILVIDDDPDMLLLLQMRLKADGYQVKISPNGVNMMDIITHSPPDLLLLDIHMEGMDGATICHLLKTNAGTAELPIVLFSANENIGAVAKECGADAFIPKPYNAVAFRDTISRLLG